MKCDHKNFSLRMNVFLSYTQSDEAIAVELSMYLKVTDGLTTIMHRKLINAGDDIQATIRDWINKSDIYLQLMSNAYFDSYERREDTALFIPKRKIIYIFKESLVHTPLYEQLDYKYCYPFIRPSTNGLGIKPINDPYWLDRTHAYSNVAVGLKKEIIKQKNREVRRDGKGERHKRWFKAIVSAYLNIFDLAFDEKGLIGNNLDLQYADLNEKITFLPLCLLQNKAQIKSYLKSHCLNNCIYFLVPIDICTIINGNFRWRSRKNELINKAQEVLAELKYDHFTYLMDLNLLETQLLQKLTKAQDSVYIGDKGSYLSEHYDEKNVIKAGEDFRVENAIAGKDVQIVQNYFVSAKGTGEDFAQNVNLKSELKTLLRKAKTQELIDRLVEISENGNKELNDKVDIQSARFYNLKDQEDKGIISMGDARIERNKINDVLARLINEFVK